MGYVAYQLSFTSSSKLHLVFNVSFLKKVIRTKFQTQTNLSNLDEEGSIWLQPQEVLYQHGHHLHQCTIKEVLVQWKDTTLVDATWEPITILQQCPHLNPRVITEILSAHGDKNSASSNSNKDVHGTEFISQHCKKVKNYTK
jgi:hypothetical protein